MKTKVSIISNIDDLPAELVAGDPSKSKNWSVVVAAAGKGSRLNWHLPKILFPIDGQSILERLVKVFKPHAQHFVFVLSPTGAPLVKVETEKLLPDRHSIAIQCTPNGMADAVLTGLGKVKTPNVIVVWGDQAALRHRTIAAGVYKLETGNFDAVIPTVIRSNPYIHFERDSNHSIKYVRQAREGDIMPKVGESDAGVFFFKTQMLKSAILAPAHQSDMRGARTNEINLLPLIPLLARNYKIASLNGVTETESLGINSLADAERMEQMLRVN
ncbi:NTP transferase domain-containing protein [Synoicihabitans lomoniglobus]|uniref:NTP transferase domain-containing protein n=1 Tax=Synoicihabitans lomoniglobus TaxID=2909285 RepID=A0AAF0CSY3_9BACT|nr:NTP transferase domain-containing protein [Opitutaceae bacterium LMO-M01]WED67371.1 NTP transferase domain-containing protein [Opitutaceae bacterium LMO-M01]